MISTALISRRRRGNASPYDPASNTLFAAMSVAPDATRKGHYDTFIRGLKTDNLWDKLTWISVFAAHDEQAARINIKTPSQVATAVNSPTFAANQGFKGDGATAELNSLVAGSTLTATSTSLFAVVRTLPTIASRPAVGYDTRHALTPQTAAFPSNTARLISNGASLGTTNAAANMFILGSRTGTTQTFQRDTAIQDTDTIASDTTNNTQTIRFLGARVGFSDAQLSAAGWGLHLDNTDGTNLRARLVTYLTAVGAM